MIEAKETLIGSITSSSTLKGTLNKAIEYISPTTQEKTITPTKEQQIVVPDDGVFALSKVTVEEIPSEYIKPSGTLDITTNGEYDIKEYEKANVNIDGFKIKDVSYLFYSNARINEIEYYTSAISDECTNYSYCFYTSSNLVEVPFFKTSNATTFSYMFYGCSKLVDIALLDFGKGTQFTSTFASCKALTKIPKFDFSNGYLFTSCFQSCSALEEIPELNFSKATSIGSMFYGCSKLKTLGGFKDLGKDYSTSQSANRSNYTLDLSYSTVLTYESLMNVINKLYDIASKGCKTQSLKLSSTSLALLSESDIAIAVNKGWSVTT